MIELHVAHRAEGIRWPLRAGDQVEVYERGELVSAFDCAWLLAVVARELLLARWRQELTQAPVDELGPLARRPGATAAGRAELARRRRTRAV